MTTNTQYEAAAKVIGKHIIGWDLGTPLVASDGCRGGVRWDPIHCTSDSMELAFDAGLIVDFLLYESIEQARAEIFNNVLGCADRLGFMPRSRHLASTRLSK